MELEKSKENKISKTRDTIICINNKENKFFNQVLKNQDVASKVKLKKAKGESSTKTLIIIYLKEYENTKFNNESVNVPFINPRLYIAWQYVLKIYLY